MKAARKRKAMELSREEREARIEALRAKLKAFWDSDQDPRADEREQPIQMFCRCGSAPCVLRLGREQNSQRGTEQQGFFL